MNKKIKLIFPKEIEKSYYSRKRQNYKNNISVKINKELIFENIDDCEENLPMILEKDFYFQKEKNFIEFDYDITFNEGEKEIVHISFLVSNNTCNVKIHRPFFVKAIVNGEFTAYFFVNDDKHFFNESYHQGNEKIIQMEFKINDETKFQAGWGCIKKSITDDKTYYDDIIMEIE